MLDAVRKDRFFGVTPEQVVRRLQRIDLARPLESSHLACIEVRDADVADLAFSHEAVEGVRRFTERCLRDGPVQLIQIDVVRAERAQTRLQSLPEPERAGVANEIVTLFPEPAFSSQYHAVAVVLDLIQKRLAKDRFGGAEAVRLCSVEEVDTEVEGLTDCPLALIRLDWTPVTSEGPGAEGETRDAQIRVSKPRILNALRTDCPRRYQRVP